METVKVLIADDHALLRKDIASILSNTGDTHFALPIEIVGEATNGMEAISLARKLSPNVVIMDISMPEPNGIEATRQIVKENPDTKVLMLTVSDDGMDLVEALKAGAKGYILKNAGRDEIIESVTAIYNGECFFGPAVATCLVDEFMNQTERLEELQRLSDHARKEKETEAGKLTKREMQILQLLAEGLNNKEIGKILHISDSTVKKHVSGILVKLQAQNRTQLAKIAAKKGLV